jgi:hypothetical protein
VWGDASLGRLGLPDVADTVGPTGSPILVNGKVVWTPRQMDFSAVDMGRALPEGGRVSVAGLGLGGAFSMYLLYGGSGPGGVLVVSGALGVDITKDRYGYPEEVAGAAAALDVILEADTRGVRRVLTPQTVSPFGNKPVVLAISAGARHAGVIAQDAGSGNAPRAFVAGKGWLGHAGDADSMLLSRPAVSTQFAPVAGVLAHEDGASCMHCSSRCCSSSSSSRCACGPSVRFLRVRVRPRVCVLCVLLACLSLTFRPAIVCHTALRNPAHPCSRGGVLRAFAHSRPHL